jgi:hypothetical protein
MPHLKIRRGKVAPAFAIFAMGPATDSMRRFRYKIQSWICPSCRRSPVALGVDSIVTIQAIVFE